MAEKKFLVDLNLGGNKAKNFRLEDYASNSAPTSNFVGRLIYTTNSTDPDRVEVYTGTGWEQVAYVSDAPVLDQDLVDIAALTGDGFLTRQSGTWEMDSSTYLTSTDLTGYVTETGSQTLTNKIYEDVTLKDRVSFTNNSDSETMYIEHSGTGTNRIISTDDISIRSLDGDIILYPGSNAQWGNDGGTGKAYVNWGNDATGAAPENEITTAGNSQVFTGKDFAGAHTIYPFDRLEDTNGFATIGYQDGDADLEGFYIDSYAGDTAGGKIFINANDDIKITSQTGNIQFYMDGAMYIGDVLADNEVATKGWVDGEGFVTLTGEEVLTNKTFNDYLSFTNPSTTPVDGEIGINDTNENFEITALSADLVLTAGATTAGNVTIIGDNINLDVPNGGDFIFKEAGTEYLNITKAYTGTTRITTTDDLAIRSTNGDILLYPGNLSGGIGKVYYGYGNANAATGASGIANPENEIITVGYVTGTSNTLSANQFLANTIETVAESFGGYSFTGDSGTDTGMFSNGDGLVSFYSNATEVAHFNDSTFTVDQDLVVTGDLTVNGTLTTLNTETVTVEDNILVLNGNVTGIPLTNAGLEVERGDYTNAAIYWNETSNFWTVDTVKDSAAAAVTHSIARKYSETLTADPAATSFVVTHSLNTRDVIAQVYTVASPYEQVEVSIEYTSVDTITVYLNTATTGDYRVVVTG